MKLDNIIYNSSLAYRRLRQKDHEFEVSLGSTGYLRLEDEVSLMKTGVGTVL